MGAVMDSKQHVTVALGRQARLLFALRWVDRMQEKRRILPSKLAVVTFVSSGHDCCIPDLKSDAFSSVTAARDID